MKSFIVGHTFCFLKGVTRMTRLESSFFMDDPPQENTFVITKNFLTKTHLDCNKNRINRGYCIHFLEFLIIAEKIFYINIKAQQEM